MKRISLIVLLAIAFLSAQTVTVSITGKVSDIGGAPLQGVVVQILAGQLQTTTAADGSYSLSGQVNTAVRPLSNQNGINDIQYNSGKFLLYAASPATISVKLYDMLGSLAATVYNGRVGQGKTEIPFSIENYGHKKFLLRVKTAASVSTYRIMSGAANTLVKLNQTVSGGNGALGKIAAVTDWLQAAKTGYQSYVEQITAYSGVMNITLSAPTPPSFGPNVFIFDPTMQMSTIQNQLTTIYGQQDANQFGSTHYAFFFKPGKYSLDVKVGFYTQALGLGQSPDSVLITGAVRAKADWLGNNNATCNFWRSAENLAVIPTQDNNVNVWGVSQGCDLRRMHIQGPLALSDGGWASGGYLADSKIDGQCNSGSQQQWFSRNDEWGSWSGGGWNMVFVGITKPPTGNFPNPPYSVIAKTPGVAEKPYLFIDNAGNYFVNVPVYHADSTLGTTWSAGVTPGTVLPIDQFYIAHAGTDNAASLNAQLTKGMNLLFTPGVYHLEASLQVIRPRTVVLGIGLPSLVPDQGTTAIKVADVNGVRVGGFILEANITNSPTLLQVGDSGSAVDHSADPVALQDIFCRAGGSFNGHTSSFVTINSNNVFGDNFWLWRADHGTGAGWTSNLNDNGLTVNGNNVTLYGLFVEHTQKYQTMWNGNNGRTYFYQSEMPYDPPNQAAWMRGTVDGYPSYNVAAGVTKHEAWGIGVYCVFSNGSVAAENAMEVPTGAGIVMRHLLTENLGGGIHHIINGTGGAATATLTQYP